MWPINLLIDREILADMIFLLQSTAPRLIHVAFYYSETLLIVLDLCSINSECFAGQEIFWSAMSRRYRGLELVESCLSFNDSLRNHTFCW